MRIVLVWLRKLRTGVIVQFLAFSLPCIGCTSPFSDLQSAHVLDKGETELTGHYSSVSFTNDGNRERIQASFGVQAAIGVDGDADFRMRYERIQLEDGNSAINVFGAGPKMVIVEDRVAFLLPFGFAFGENISTSETWETHPTFLFSSSPITWLEVNASAKALFRLSSAAGIPRLAFNLGFGIGPDPRRVVLRPEIGFMFDPGGNGYYSHLSVGVTFALGDPKSGRGVREQAAGKFGYSGVEFRERNGMVEIIGGITNGTGRDYMGAKFLVVIYDALGGVLAKDYVHISNFKDGETRSFNTYIVQVEYSRIDTCTIWFDDGY